VEAEVVEVAAELVAEAQAAHHLRPAAREAQHPLPGARVQPQHLHPVQSEPALQLQALLGPAQIRTRRRRRT
jgi:hypothetical protein